MNKILGTICLLFTLAGLTFWIVSVVTAYYEWSNSAESYWNLADKTSTLSAKAKYIDQFIVALKAGNLADNDALYFKTADNSCAANITAVETLKQRLDEIKGMDVTSFQYQQAIQQITAQEQGEATAMMSTLSGCWWKSHHYFLWNPWMEIFFVLMVALGFILTIIVFNLES